LESSSFQTFSWERLVPVLRHQSETSGKSFSDLISKWSYIGFSKAWLCKIWGILTNFFLSLCWDISWFKLVDNDIYSLMFLSFNGEAGSGFGKSIHLYMLTGGKAGIFEDRRQISSCHVDIWWYFTGRPSRSDPRFPTEPGNCFFIFRCAFCSDVWQFHDCVAEIQVISDPSHAWHLLIWNGNFQRWNDYRMKVL